MNMRWIKYVLLIILLSGCIQNEAKMYACNNGNTVDDPNKCPPITTTIQQPNIQTETTQPITLTSHLCNNGSAYEIEKCKVDLAINSNDLSLCDKFASSTKVACYSGIARNKNDVTICEKLGDTRSTEWCKITLIVSQGDKDKCADITGQNEKDACYGAIAVLSKNPSLCSNIQVSRDRNSCFTSIAMSTNETSVCEKIGNNTSEKEKCYANVAYSKEDCTICEKLTDSKIKQSCNRVCKKITSV